MQGTSFKIVGNWRAKVHTTLSQALQVSIDVFHREAGQAVKHAVILMAQSAASKGNPVTPTAKKRRELLSNAQGQFVERWRQGWSNAQKIYKWKFHQTANFLGNEGYDAAGWEKAQIIKAPGLARRSWMWGLAEWGGKEERRAIPGTYETAFKQTKEMVEAVKRNKLGYINKIMMPGWEAIVATRATNKILAQSAKKMEKKFTSMINAGGAMNSRMLASYFLPEAKAA